MSRGATCLAADAEESLALAQAVYSREVVGLHAVNKRHQRLLDGRVSECFGSQEAAGQRSPWWRTATPSRQVFNPVLPARSECQEAACTGTKSFRPRTKKD